MTQWRFSLVAALMLAGLPAVAVAQLGVSGLTRVASGPGARTGPVVVTTPTGYGVFWEESPAGSASSRILRQLVGFDGTLLGTPAAVATQWASQGQPTVARAEDRSWLGYSFTERGMRAGDRDLALVGLDPQLQPAPATLRLTRDPQGRPPVTQASPALLRDPDTGRLILASSIGTHRGEHGRAGSPHDSVNIEIRVLDPHGTPERHFVVRGPDQVGESVAPSLALLPPGWRERYILAYVSNAGHRDRGEAGYSVYFELFNPEWRVVGGRHFMHPTGGAATPSVASVDGKLFVAWVDNATRDIVVSELDQTLHPMWPMRLGEVLAQLDFGEQFGGRPWQLGAPALFDDFGTLGLAFVATWEDPAGGPPRQELFIAKVRYRE